MNLTDAYASSVLAAKRHFSLAADYTQVVITDIIAPRSTDSAVTLTWTMHTYANITVDATGRAATLEQDGRKLRAAVSSLTGEGSFQAVDLNITSIPSNQSTVFDSSPGTLMSSLFWSNAPAILQWSYYLLFSRPQSLNDASLSIARFAQVDLRHGSDWNRRGDPSANCLIPQLK